MSDLPLLELLPIRIVEGEPVLWGSLEAVLKSVHSALQDVSISTAAAVSPAWCWHFYQTGATQLGAGSGQHR